VVLFLADEVFCGYYWIAAKHINSILENFFSTQLRLLSALTLRTKNFYFEQLLHTVSLFCGKAVD
jgi:hypothetical protein